MTLLLGDCLEVLRTLDDCSVDAVVTDPPYGINFMGKAWDGKAIEEAAARPHPLGGATRLTGSPDSLNRKLITRTGSGFQNRAGEAGAYDFSLGRFGDERDWTGIGGPLGHGAGKARGGGRERGGAMHAGSYDLTPSGNRGFQRWCEQWAGECLRVLKPGGHLLSFGGTRTYHRLGCGVEDAGFEIRDCMLYWGFGSGFPKSHNLNGDWEGWGTALKPGYEPIVVARKPLTGTVAANVLAHGTGALNIDGCRIEGVPPTGYPNGPGGKSHHYSSDKRSTEVRPGPWEGHTIGRWPANVILDEAAGALLDAQTGTLTSGARAAGAYGGIGSGPIYGTGAVTPLGEVLGDSGGASRFFYCAKVSRAERNAGLKGFPLTKSADDGYGSIQTPTLDRSTPRENWDPHKTANNHPTVKPIDLMRWLVRLVTPPGGLVLDPFLGSGTTGIAAALEGMRFVGIEREADYMRIAEARIAFWAEHGEYALTPVTGVRETVERVTLGQLSYLDEPA